MFSGLSSRFLPLVRASPVRRLHVSASLRAEEPVGNATSKLSKDQLKKREVRRFAQKKAAARRPASEHPLYMPVDKALRFLRAAEVGQPQSQQTLSVTTIVISERGAPLLSGNVSFPNALKELKIAVFTNDEQQAQIAREKFNCHVVGGSELVEKIKQGQVPLDFDKSFATPEIATLLASQLGRILGPRGLLPAAKKGTVSENLESLIKDSMGTLPFRQRGNNISIAVGRCSFTDKQLLENIVAAQKSVKEALANQKAKKPSLLGQTTLTSTRGPGIVIDFA
ncbi:mitochondrial 54S ribosomal protein uL1m [Lachancea thermotolerans CBS 6340]|uniref:KLTH0G13552p n=1 Tax=Lachancea thermotolerans (strain ATCC 56472 / CBS 6340 / NRRL Y-8284) TaxID=559295 RepID=C5DN23_LACTC|nr:mitochondrial 54S ribosomal protein MRPL1 [Lachancea thermotolerans CBS 6340]CAR25184.1 KLTH0G13552p [Lachancea thermotolerans CBS 6340]